MSFRNKSDLFIVVRRSIGSGYDMIEAFVPLARPIHDKTYANHTADLRLIGWFPARRDYGSKEVGNIEGPRADHGPEIQLTMSSQDLRDVEADVKLAKKYMAKYEKLLLKPTTFAESVAIWADITGLPVKVYDPAEKFERKAMIGASSETLKTPEDVKSWLASSCRWVTLKNLESLGLNERGEKLEPKAEETTEVTQS